ncbi:tyrosine-type recombinase/integrase [Aliivibrio fischeri]|uniref:tyrosine-type recombinase/integrase n=1 Tax=Aliivibrio fischeri TaxID=668 RepID=UPI0012DACC34|nr:tyrosine-type recombinase/integrase [Aliivibrio fischeri]MUK41200.1 tyrosine-type recombinase/integrase [Aliivibrio fischeri]
MIKLLKCKLERQKAIIDAQSKVGIYTDYLNDVLSPAVKRGNWNEFETLDIGFTLGGKSLGKVGDNDAWRKLQLFFEPNATKINTLNFENDEKVIERNLRNQLKALALKMMWLSPKNYSFQSICDTIVNLKKLVPPLLSEGENSIDSVDFERLETWVVTDFTDIDFERDRIYTALNKLHTEAEGLPFEVALTKRLTPSVFGLAFREAEQYTVIPQRLYYMGLQKSEELVNELYPIRDKLSKLSCYISTYFDKIYEGYAKYLLSDESKTKKGKIHWRLGKTNTLNKERTIAFQEAFLALSSPSEVKTLKLLKRYKPEIKSNYIDRFHPNNELSIGTRKVTHIKEAQSLFKQLNGGCCWALMSRTGMRSDEIYHIHTANGCTTELISKQTIHIIHADLSKTVRGFQSKQDEFVTTEVGKKAYEILQALHKPLREHAPESHTFFHKTKDGCGAMRPKEPSRHAKAWFKNTMGEMLELTNEDVVDLKTSDPNLSFEVGNKYEFTGHQLRRSFAYYLIGYELCNFPQLKQQFSHISMAMTRHYAKNASKFQKIRQKKKTLAHEIDEERIDQKARVYLNIYQKLANKERVAGGKGKEFAKNMMKTDRNLFKDKVDNEMLSLNYWKKQIRTQNRHIHAVAPGIYCTSTTCGLRTLVNLMECVDCKNDYILDAVFAEAKRKEAEIHMFYDIENNELTPQTASEFYIKVQAAERIMDDLDINYEPVIFPDEVKSLLIPYGVTS